MARRDHTRQKLFDLLGRAAEQAQHAELYHDAAADPAVAMHGPPAQQAARDAAAMQLIELVGCAERFEVYGEANTTLGRLDNVLSRLRDLRTQHTHPEFNRAPPPVTPQVLGNMILQLKKAIGNVDSESWERMPSDQGAALRHLGAGLLRIEMDGLPDPGALRSRDLHYAGYYHEIHFGRLAKETGLFDNFGSSEDPRAVDVNKSIFDSDHFAHKFHALRKGPVKSDLPVSVVSAEHRDRVPRRLLSEIVRELRREQQTLPERMNELVQAAEARIREELQQAMRKLAGTYADLTGDPKGTAPVQTYLQRHDPPLTIDAIEDMRDALYLAAAGEGYMAAPETARDGCLALALALDAQGDRRLVDILDAAEKAAQKPSIATADDQKDVLSIGTAGETEATLGLEAYIPQRRKHNQSL
jgi:hypothetical protein